ncbi:hypothetical protein [uncultured Dokdonia sp.]|uniref:hypothetical protein n=1 Tax=uncultured Dokdonia sp. TaxID=575653 RepID=UPI002609FD7A|nr:hypothetical protein [uncultured Dokdonia sp.]
MERKTTQTYKREILKKYKEDIDGEIYSYLVEPQRKRIRKACALVFEKRNHDLHDQKTLKDFFGFREENEEEKLTIIETYELDKFRPIESFLKGITKKPEDICVEMVSWLLDFKPRPFSRYLSSDHIHTPIKDESRNDTNSKESITEKIDPSNPTPKEDTVSDNSEIDISTENKKKPPSRKKRKWSLTLKIVIAFGAVLITTSYFLKDKIQLVTSPPSEEQRCMVWNEDHYEEVICSWKSLARLEEYDKKLIDNFQKIEVNINTQFFYQNGSPRIWYYKKPNGKIDYFTANGFHPIFKKDVKPISQHIINKYVLKSPFNTSFVNTPEKEELALFIFRNDTLDLEIAKQLQKTLFSNYRSTPYLIAAKKLNSQIKEHLQQGDLSMYKSDMKKHIDYLCVGSVSYTYRESGVKPKRFACDIQLTYEIFDTQGNPELDKSYSKTITGSGFTKQEAQQNALKKITR